MEKNKRFKFALPIIKTRSAIEKIDGKEKEVRYVEGVASSTDLDLHGDRMTPEAIKSMADSLKRHVIKLNAEHDTSWQSELGDISKLEVSEKNELLVEARLNEMSKSNDLWLALTEMNKKLGLSIGGYVKEYEMVKEDYKDEEDGEIKSRWVRQYKDIELDHIAVTSSPANPKTWVNAIAKSIEEDSKILIKKLEEKEKEEIMKPYPNEHACRLRDPDDFQDGSFRSMEREHEGKKYRVIVGRPKGKNSMEEQAYRYDKEVWSAEEARNHCESHKGSFEPAKKSIEETQEERNKKIKELAREIARTIQNIEVDLLLELTEKTLAMLTNDSLLLVEKNFELMKKEYSLEADESLKKDDAEVKEPVTTEAETSATPENESKVEGVSETKPEEETKEDASFNKEDKSSEETQTEGDKTETPEAKETGEQTAQGEEKQIASEEKTSDEKTEEKSEEKKSEETSTEKTENATAELLKSLSEQIKQVLQVNEDLKKRIEELETQPASRKTVELSKGLGDEDSETKSAEDLEKEMEQKIADLKKNHASDPNLFAKIQRIRAEYAKKLAYLG